MWTRNVYLIKASTIIGNITISNFPNSASNLPICNINQLTTNSVTHHWISATHQTNWTRINHISGLSAPRYLKNRDWGLLSKEKGISKHELSIRIGTNLKKATSKIVKYIEKQLGKNICNFSSIKLLILSIKSTLTRNNKNWKYDFSFNSVHSISSMENRLFLRGVLIKSEKPINQAD